MKRIVIFSVLVCLFGACVSRPPEEEKAAPPFIAETVEETPTAPAARTEPKPVPPPPEKPPQRLPRKDGLDSPLFGDIPLEAKDYLRTLAEAFRAKDGEFLIAQGEPQYEKEQRFRHEEDVYLAMLYRVGPYSTDTHWNSPDIPRMDYSQIEAIEYLGWEEKGPMLQIAGLLYYEDSSTLPCGVTLLWRLLEPKILGHRPDKGL